MAESLAHLIDPTESEQDRRARLTEERRLLDEAEAEADHAGSIPADEVHAWVRSLHTSRPLAMPKPRHT